LVVLDCGLPGIDGLTFCRWLRAQPGGDRCVILVVTGRGEPDDLAAILDAGADDYLTKPFSADLLQIRLTVAERQVDLLAERKSLEEHLWQLARHDVLTGLPNRSLFTERLEQALAADASGPGVALLFLDLDGFKHVNDSLGHVAGDRLLVQVGRRLQSVLRGSDAVARFGGDEFTVLLDPAHDATAALGLAERLLAALEIPFIFEDVEAVVGACVGVALGVPGQTDAGSLVRDADIALYRAKAAGIGTCVLFEPGMQAQARERLRRDSELRRALERGEFRLHYQPELNLRSGRVVGLEALIRWDHPRLGLLPPIEFLPLAEETRLLDSIGQWVLREVGRQIVTWRGEMRSAVPTVAINVAAPQLVRGDAVEEIARLLLETGLPAGAIALEITEQAVIDDPRALAEAVRGVKALGVRVSLDNFGSGVSSLGSIRDFPVDALKLDRSFMERLGRDSASLAVVRAVVSLAHALGIEVTASGIETAEQLASVRRAGADRGQGFFFAHPAPVDSLDEVVNRSLPLQKPNLVVGLPVIGSSIRRNGRFTGRSPRTA
jgi:diguanylate cyclase (GGDEF)-like protein